MVGSACFTGLPISIGGLSDARIYSIRPPKECSFVTALCCGLLVAALALASTAFAAGGGGGGAGRRWAAEAAVAGAAAVARGGGGGGAGRHRMNQTDLTTCAPGMVWDTKHHKCLTRHSGVLPDPDLTEYAYALAKADRYQEAIDVLDLLDNPNTPRALNYRGYATRKLGTHRRRNWLLSQVGRARPQLSAGARVPWGSLCHRRQIRPRQRAIVDDQEDLRYGLRVL